MLTARVSFQCYHGATLDAGANPEPGRRSSELSPVNKVEVFVVEELAEGDRVRPRHCMPGGESVP